jgi:hypothetical protein
MGIPKVNLQLATPMMRVNSQKAYDVLSQFDSSNIKEQLLAYPERIKEQKLVVSQKRQALKDAELTVKEVEAGLVMEIASEVNENGKAKFSNAESRNAELLARKKVSAEFNFAESDRRNAEADLEEAQAELEQLQDKFKAYRYIARLTAEELAVINNLSENEEVYGNE